MNRNYPAIHRIRPESIQPLVWGWVLVLLLIPPISSAAAEMTPAEDAFRTRMQELKLGLIEIKGQLLLLLEQSRTPSAQAEIFLEVKDKTQGLPDPHSMPNFISLRLDRQMVQEHHYSDTERVALQRGGIQRLYVANLDPGEHQLVVNYGGLEKNGRKYLKVASISLPKSRQRQRILLSLRVGGGEDPHLDHQMVEAIQDFSTRRGVYESYLDQHLLATALLFSSRSENITAPLKEEAFFSLARSLLFLDLHQEARRLFFEMAQRHPDPARRAEAWFYLGKIHYQQDRFTEALESLRHMTKDLPFSLQNEALVLMGNSHLRLGSWQQAEQIYSRMSRYSEFYPYALHGTASAQLRQGRLSEAVLTLQKITSLSHRGNTALLKLKANARLVLGLLHLQQGEPHKAALELSEISNLHQDRDLALYGKGIAALNLGDLSAALQAFSDLSASFPTSPYTHEARLASAASYSRSQVIDRSIEEYRQALKIFNQHLDEAQRRLAELAQSQGKDQEFILQDLEADGIDTTGSRLIEQYRQLLLLEQEVLQEQAQLPPESQSLLAPQIHRTQGQMVQLKQDLAAYQSTSRIVLLKRQMQWLDHLAVRACLGIADQLSVELADLKGEEGLTLEE